MPPGDLMIAIIGLVIVYAILLVPVFIGIMILKITLKNGFLSFLKDIWKIEDSG